MNISITSVSTVVENKKTSQKSVPLSTTCLMICCITKNRLPANESFFFFFMFLSFFLGREFFQNVSAVNDDIMPTATEQNNVSFMYIIVCKQRSKCICNTKNMYWTIFCHDLSDFTNTSIYCVSICS